MKWSGGVEVDTHCRGTEEHIANCTFGHTQHAYHDIAAEVPKPPDITKCDGRHCDEVTSWSARQFVFVGGGGAVLIHKTLVLDVAGCGLWWFPQSRRDPRSNSDSTSRNQCAPSRVNGRERQRGQTGAGVRQHQ